MKLQDVFDLWPSMVEMVIDCGLVPMQSTVVRFFQWERRGRIPIEAVIPICDAAKKRGVIITERELIEMIPPTRHAIRSEKLQSAMRSLALQKKTPRGRKTSRGSPATSTHKGA